jgi:predicted HD phosphohydrolase
MTNPLSPAAQAVLQAACIHHGLFNEEIVQRRRSIAAALRASADGCDSDWIGLTVIHHLYAIADELEIHQ